jgi:hypothetical protein
VLEHVVAQDYRVEERLTLDIVVRQGRATSSIGAGRSTRPAWKRARDWACWGWSSRSTGGRCRRSAATGCWCLRRPDPPPTPSPRAVRCCGRTSRPSWWCPTTPTRCSARPMVTSPDADRHRDRGWRQRRPGVLRRPSRDGDTRRGRLEVTRCGTPVKWAPGQRAVHRPTGAQVPVAGHRLAWTRRCCAEIRNHGARSDQRRDRRVRPRPDRADRRDRHGQDHGGHRAAPPRWCPRRRQQGAVGSRPCVVEGRFTTTELDGTVATQRRRDPGFVRRRARRRRQRHRRCVRSAVRDLRGPTSAAAVCPPSR